MKTITLNKQQLDRMSPDELCNLLLKAHEVKATAVVRRKDGSVKYDNPEFAGTYGEEFLSGHSEVRG